MAILTGISFYDYLCRLAALLIGEQQAFLELQLNRQPALFMYLSPPSAM
ncbi:hypothetical protein [Paenibacillus sp. MBLB4367]